MTGAPPFLADDDTDDPLRDVSRPTARGGTGEREGASAPSTPGLGGLGVGTCEADRLIHEEWRDAPGWEGLYSVSSVGRVRAEGRDVVYDAPHQGRVVQHKPGRILKPYVNHGGYPCVILAHEKRRLHRTVHSLVAEAFLGQRPDGHVVRHLDNNRANPNVANLAYGTRADNSADMVGHGTCLVGDLNHNTKLREEQVVEIFELFRSGRSKADIARRFGVDPSLVRSILARQHWKHVPVPDRLLGPAERVASKLAPEDVAEVRRLLGDGRSVKDVSRQFGVSLSAIYRIRNGVGWRNLGA